MKHRFATLLLSFLALLSGKPASADPAIGWIGPLTGDAAVLGTDALDAVRLVIDETNRAGGAAGAPIRLIIEDDGMDTKRTVTAYTRLAHQERVNVIFVYSYSGLFAVAPRAHKDGVLLLDPLDCDDDIAALPGSVICIAKRTEDFGKTVSQAILARGQLPTGVLYFENDAFPLKTARSVRSALEAAGKSLAVFEGYSAGTRDFRGLAAKVRGANLRSLAVFGYDEIGQILKQLHTIGAAPQLYTLSTAISPSVQAAAGPATEGALCPAWTAARTVHYTAFIERFRSAYGRAPLLDVSTVPSFDAASLVVAALRSRGCVRSGSVDSSCVTRALLETKGHKGASGTITVDADGSVRTLDVSLQRISGGRLRPVD